MFISIAAFAVVFSLAVLVHEFGHFMAARRAGVKVYEFSMGFPFSPRLFTFFRHKETEFTLRLLPLGGFVSFSQGSAEGDGELLRASRLKQALIMSAGSFFNIAFAFIIFVAVFNMGNHLPFIDAVELSARTVWEIISGTFAFLAQVVSGRGAVEGVSGPVGIAVLAGKAASKGFIHLLFFSGILSMSLGIMNLLPLPALDGGQLFVLLVESVLGRPLGVKIHQAVNVIGLLFFVVLAMFITYSDIARLLS